MPGLECSARASDINPKGGETKMAKIGKEARKRRGRAPKVAAVAELKDMFEKGDGIVFMDNHGLTLAQATVFRQQLRGQNVAVKVEKNTLLKRAFQDAGIDPEKFSDKLTGPTMVAVGLEDPISPAKGIAKFLKENEGARLEIKGGILKSESEPLDVSGVDKLSKLPGREEMIALLLGSLNAPTQNMCYALNASVSHMGYALAALQRKLEEEAA